MNEYCQRFNLSPQKLPRHIGIIMDGNGRWATSKHLPRLAGHRKGVERVREITESCSKLGVSALTLYAFSDENWRRPEDEVSGLMGLLRWYLRAERDRLMANNVRFRLIGDRLKLSKDILAGAEHLEEETSKNTGLFFTVAISYGGRGEILRAVKRVFAKVEASDLFLQDLDEEAFESCLDTAGLPELDLVIRTSGEQRINNFLLWQAAYAEFLFDTRCWPDFSEQALIENLKHYAARERRFGQTSAQIRSLKPKDTSVVRPLTLL